jgi:hypothetical protein
MLGVAVSAAVSRLLPCKLGISAANFARFFSASNSSAASTQQFSFQTHAMRLLA